MDAGSLKGLLVFLEFPGFLLPVIELLLNGLARPLSHDPFGTLVLHSDTGKGRRLRAQ